MLRKDFFSLFLFSPTSFLFSVLYQFGQPRILPPDKKEKILPLNIWKIYLRKIRAPRVRFLFWHYSHNNTCPGYFIYLFIFGGLHSLKCGSLLIHLKVKNGQSIALYTHTHSHRQLFQRGGRFSEKTFLQLPATQKDCCYVLSIHRTF